MTASFVRRVGLACLALLLAAPLTFAAAAPVVFAQTSSGGDSGGLANCFAFACPCIGALFVLAVIAVPAASLWVVFTKAGKPGWAALVPIYNAIVAAEIVEKPMWFAILLMIPCTAPIGGIMFALELAQKFGKDTMFAVGLILLPFVFYPLLAFGDAKYLGTGVMPPS